MRRHFCYIAIISSLSSILFLSGCMVSVRDNLVTGPVDALQEGKCKPRESTLNEKMMSEPFKRLEAAYWQIKLGDTTKNNAFKDVKDANPLPGIFTQDPVISKMVVATTEAICEGKPRNANISQGDIKKTVRMIGENFGINDLNKSLDGKGNQFKDDSKKAVYKITQSYLYAYFTEENGFIDREGTKYVAPDFKGKVENSTITAVVGILWEAVADDLLSTPVWTKDGKYLTKGGLQPTASKLKYATDEKVVDTNKKGIDENKLKVIRYLSSLAGEQSKVLSGMVYKLFGKLNIGFVLGGGFSFGDNDTLAKVLDTTFEVVAKRSVLETSRHLFKDIPYGLGVRAPDPTKNPLEAQAFELLNTLQPPKVNER